MQFSFDPGTEIYIPFAKKKLAQWKAQYVSAGVASFHKRVDVSDGSVIYIDSTALGRGQYNDRIRITGGRFYTFATMPEPAVTVTYTMLSDTRAPTAGFLTNGASIYPAVLGTITVRARIVGPGGTNDIIGSYTVAAGGTSPFEVSGYGLTPWELDTASTFPNWGVLFAAGTTTSGSRTWTHVVDGLGNITVSQVGSYTSTPITTSPEYIASLGGDPSDSMLGKIRSGEIPSEWQATLRDAAAAVAPVDETSPSDQDVVLALIGPIVDGVSKGLFGDPAGQTQTQVFGSARLRYTKDDTAFTFVRWTEPSVGTIDDVPPSHLAGMNAMLRWVGTPPAEADPEEKTYRAAVVAAL